MSTTLHAGADGAAGGHIRIDAEDGVLTVTLDRPAHQNEISAAMFETLLAFCAEQAERPTARAIVLRAEGESFCTGRERSARDLAGLRAEAARLIALKRAWRALPAITIARVHGAAAGFGLGMALMCDFAIVADDAPLSFPEMRMGLPPAAIMAYLGEFALPRHAFPLVLFAETFSAQHAREIGLVNEVVPKAELDAAVGRIVEKVRHIDPASARACKELFFTMGQGSFDANCRLAVDALPMASATLIHRVGP